MRCYFRFISLLLVIMATSLGNALAQQETVYQKGASPADFFLHKFNFFYAGEAKNRNMYIVRNGKVTWSYIDTTGKGEISDAVLMTNGNVLFAHQFGVTLIDSAKKVLWNYDAPPGHEIHSAQPIGKNHVLFIQNGDTAKLFVINILTGKTAVTFQLPVKDSRSVHGQMRHARLTDRGTVLVAHMDLQKISEYDVYGHELWALPVAGVWSAVELKNGHLLVASNNGFVRELTHNGDIIWEYTTKDSGAFNIRMPQLATRLPNGNTLINNWFNLWNGLPDAVNPPFQAVEVTPGKEVVSTLKAWHTPVDLGPSTTIQLLNYPDGISEHVHFGYIR